MGRKRNRRTPARGGDRATGQEREDNRRAKLSFTRRNSDQQTAVQRDLRLELEGEDTRERQEVLEAWASYQRQHAEEGIEA